MQLLSNGGGSVVMVVVEEWNLMRTGLAVFVCGQSDVAVDVEEWEFEDWEVFDAVVDAEKDGLRGVVGGLGVG